MKGKPKYQFGDKVIIELGGKEHVGEIYLIDANGTWDDPSDVSYDVMVHDYIHPDANGKISDCLCKHIIEKDVKPYGKN